MKIWSFTSVKDEEDIIESFVRYNMCLLDGMVISDNRSNDQTYEILLKLKNEGYNIDLIQDDSAEFNEFRKKNELLKYTVSNHSPDILLPLDADEFVCSTDCGNPRKVLESLDPSIVFLYPLIDYVLTGREDEKELFVPKRICQRKVTFDNQGKDFKCIIPKFVQSYSNLVLMSGAHGINFGEITYPKNHSKINSIYLAHFPVRSSFQIQNRIILGRLNHLASTGRIGDLGFHQYRIFDLIKKHGSIDQDVLSSISKHYNSLDNDSDIETVYLPVDCSFCGEIALKYTKPADNTKLLANALHQSEIIITSLRNRLEKESVQASKVSEYEKKIESLINQMREKESVQASKVSEYEKKIESLINQIQQEEKQTRKWRKKYNLKELIVSQKNEEIERIKSDLIKLENDLQFYKTQYTRIMNSKTWRTKMFIDTYIKRK